ncbi:MAG: endonuclease/exonuclease/phosphatase family protein [Phycisphaerales bacterium]
MADFGHSTGKIAAWNLAGFKSLRAGRLRRQAKGLALLDAEVIALVEVNPITAIDTLKKNLKKDFKVEYRSRILAQNNKLNIGVLFKKGVTANNPRFIAGSDLGNPELRQAFVIDMKIGKFDFVLIIVHLKSSRRLVDQKTRDKQAKVIGKFITDRRNQDQEDILLAGDFNMIPGQDVSNFHHLGGDDIMDFVSSWDLQDRYSHILPKGRANLLDGFAITRKFSKEYIRGSLRVFPMHWSMDIGREKFRDTVSDHLPILASFKIHKDTG